MLLYLKLNSCSGYCLFFGVKHLRTACRVNSVIYFNIVIVTEQKIKIKINIDIELLEEIYKYINLRV